MHFVHISSSHGSKKQYIATCACFCFFVCTALFKFKTYALQWTRHALSTNPTCTQAKAFILQTVGIAFWLSSSKSLSQIDTMPRRLCEGSMVNTGCNDILQEQIPIYILYNCILFTFEEIHIYMFDSIIQMALNDGFMGRLCICNPYASLDCQVSKQARDWWRKAWALCSKKLTWRATKAWVYAISPCYNYGSYPKGGLMAKYVVVELTL